MRYVAPARQSLNVGVFDRQPLAGWSEYREWLAGTAWPGVDELNARRASAALPRFVAQTPALLADKLHYEERIARHAAIATRENNWHDLFNAMVWLRYPGIKCALNARQVAEIALMGPRERSRAQCALTHFDEGGIVVGMRDESMLAAWDRHDWQTLFRDHAEAWTSGAISVRLFGHALLEHALSPDKLLVGKALVFVHDGDASTLLAACADAIDRAQSLNDPQELRPLPLSGLPGWHPRVNEADFYTSTACFQPLREGRVYPAPIRVDISVG
jgi:hypothetical protein